MSEQQVAAASASVRPGARVRDAGRWLAAHVPWRLLGIAGLTASLGIAGYGQHIITDRGFYGENFAVLPRLDVKLTSFYYANQSVAFSIPIFFGAMVLFAVSTALVCRWRAPTSPDPMRGGWPNDRRFWIALAAGGLVIAAGFTHLLRHMVEYRHETSDVWLFFGLLIAGTLLFAIADWVRLRGRPPAIRFHVWEVALVGALVALFMALTIRDLTDWQYAWIGDEGQFLNDARKVLEAPKTFNLLGQRGPYGYHPLLTTLAQATVMRFAGDDIFGWKLTSVLVIAATLPPFYVLLKLTVGTRAAVFGTAILSFSHYLYAYAHTGYDNIFALFPTVVGFACFFGGLRTNRMALFFASGAAAGLGFYTFYSSRLGIGILAVAFGLMGWKHWRWERIVPLVVGFALAVTPIFAAERWQVFEASRHESAATGRSFEELIWFLLKNTPQSVLAFNYSPFGIHYTYGSLLDEISAALALLGLGFCVSRVRHEGARFLLVWFLVAIVVTGIFHPRQDGVGSRLHYALPPMAAFAGLAVDRIVAAYASMSARPALGRVLVAACVLVLMPAVLASNIHRFWEVTPEYGPGPAQGLIYREGTGPACYAEGQRTLAITEGGPASIPAVFDMYGRPEAAPLTMQFADSVAGMDDALRQVPISCIFMTPPGGALVAPFVLHLLDLARERPIEFRLVRDRTGVTVVRVIDLAP